MRRAARRLYRRIKRTIKREPVRAMSFLQVVLAAGVSFGVDLSDGQMASVLALAAVLLGIGVRQQVTPVAEK